MPTKVTLWKCTGNGLHNTEQDALNCEKGGDIVIIGKEEEALP